MILHGFNKHLYMAPDVDIDAGGGGVDTSDSDTGVDTDPQPDPTPQQKSYTEKEVNQREAKLRRRYDREIKELKAANAETRKLLEEIRTNTTPPPPDDNVPPTDLAGRMEIMEKRHERALEELRAQRDAEREAREDERTKRLEIEKDRLLQDAIVAAGVLPKNRIIAERFFRPQIEWDQLDEKWLFKTKAGNFVEVMDGVAEELPDNLKPSRLKTGGAGSGVGMPGAARRAHKDLEAAEKTLADLKAKALRNGSRGEWMAKFRRQKQVVDSLRRAVANKK